MAKKTFKGGLGSLLGEDTKKVTRKKETRGRPRTNFKKVDSTSEEGTKVGETRATFILNKENLDKLKSLAYWERLSIKEVVAEMVQQYIDKYEKKHGVIKIKRNKK